MAAAATKPKPPPAKKPPGYTQAQYDAIVNGIVASTVTMPAHEALKELGVELLAVVVLVLLAGSSPRGAKIATTIVVTLWFVSLILYWSPA